MTQQNGDLYSLRCIAASFAATYFAGVTHPLELIKTRFQSHDGKISDNLVPKYRGIRNALSSIYKDEGFKGLYKGFYVSLFSQACSMGFFFWQYETRKSRYEAKGYQTMDAVTYASVQASLLATLLTQPLWVVKTRMLLNVNQKVSELSNFKKQVTEINQQHGYKGFLKGLQLSLVLSLSGVIQMYVYEGTKMLYDRLPIPQSGLDEKNFVCGGLSKFFSSLLSYPITTLRTRIQQNQFVGVSGQQKYKGIGELARRTWSEEGVMGFYKGISANLMRGIIQRGIYFYFYEMLKRNMFPDYSPKY